MTEQNLIKLSDADIILDELNNDIYIDFRILGSKLEDSFKKSKKLYDFFQKKIIFRFNGYYFEVDKDTTIEEIKASYEFQGQQHHQNHVNKVLENATARLKEENIKLTIEEVSKELLLDNQEGIYKPYIRLCDQKQFTNKLYRIYRQNHNSEKIELLLPTLEVPKVMLKK